MICLVAKTNHAARVCTSLTERKAKKIYIPGQRAVLHAETNSIDEISAETVEGNRFWGKEQLFLSLLGPMKLQIGGAKFQR
jgi:hypothetical protein